jgi:Flp pilus assembly protein TadB
MDDAAAEVGHTGSARPSSIDGVGRSARHGPCRSVSSSPNRGKRMDAKRIFRIGLLLIVAWIVLKVVFKLVGFVFHLFLIAGLIFIIYYVATNVLGKGRPRQY